MTRPADRHQARLTKYTSLLYSRLNSVPVIRSKPAKNFFRMFWTLLRLGSGASRPPRDLQYHRANSLTSTFLGVGQFSRRHSEAGTPCVDMNLRGWGQHSGESVGCSPRGKPVGNIGHPHGPLIQGLPLVGNVSLAGLVLRLQLAVLLFVRSRYPAVLLRRSLVILGRASSTHGAREGGEWRDQGGGASRRRTVGTGLKRRVRRRTTVV